jgi:eukaryotic-like serine/threonine-protein kinase
MTDRPVDGSAHLDPDSTRVQPSGRRATETIGPYRLLELVGEGGMGEVWLAEQTQPVRRHVALKIIKPGMDTAKVVARFEAERQALALMSHPAIAQVFDAGTTPQGRPFFVMEYVRGETITAYCNRHRLTTRQRLDLFIEVCEGVQHAHQKGIIHRDLKPSNVLVTLRDNRPVPKIIDFGVATATTQSLTERTLYTELGVLIGTPEYMSPEQAEMTGLDIDTRTDVYALGVTLYELLTGALPFASHTLREKGLTEIRRILRDTDPPRPSTRVTSLGPAAATVAYDRRTEVMRLVSQLRGDLDWITMKALEKDRTRRYGAVSDLAADLRRHLDNLPVLASPPSSAYRVRKFVRRHRFGVAVATTLVTVLVAFAAATTIQARRIARERDRAERVSAFLVGLFEASDPDKMKGATVTALDLIDRGVERLSVELKDEPETRATLLHSIGRIYARLGRWDAAQRTLEQAVLVRRTLTGRDRLDLANTLNELGNVLSDKGDLGQSDAVYRESLDIRRRVLGPNHRDVALSINNLAGNALIRGRYSEAEELHKEAVSIMKRVGTPADVAGPLLNLGLVFIRQGNFTAATDALRESVDIAQRNFGGDNTLTLAAMAALGHAFSEAGEYEKAEPLEREVLTTRRKLLGNNHPAVVNALENLGNTVASLGHLDDAEQMLRESVSLSRATWPEPHLQTAWALNDLAGVECERGAYNDAERLYREAVTILQKLDTDPDNLARSWYGLGDVSYRRGQWAEAEKYFSMDFELLKKTAGTAPIILAYPEETLGRLLTERGRQDEAEPLLRHALESLRRDLPPDHWRIGYGEALLGAWLASLGHFDESEPLLLKGYETLRTKRGDREEGRYTVGKLVALFEAWGKPEKAAEWRGKLPHELSPKP